MVCSPSCISVRLLGGSWDQHLGWAKSQSLQATLVGPSLLVASRLDGWQFWGLSGSDEGGSRFKFRKSKIDPEKMNMEGNKWRFGTWFSFSTGWFFWFHVNFQGCRIESSNNVWNRSMSVWVLMVLRAFRTLQRGISVTNLLCSVEQSSLVWWVLRISGFPFSALKKVWSTH